MADLPSLSEDLFAFHMHVHKRCHRHLFDAMAGEELSRSQFRLLDQLRGGGTRPTICRAAAIMGVTRSAASRSVDELVRRGLVRREADDRDERVKRLVITERGEQVVYRLDVAHAKGIIDFTESLAPRDRKRLQAALGPVLGRQDPDEADTLAKAAA